MLRLRPISLRDANEYVRKYHRHHKPVAGHKFSIGCEADGELVGVIIAGRPVSRYTLDDIDNIAKTYSRVDNPIMNSDDANMTNRDKMIKIRSEEHTSELQSH